MALILDSGALVALYDSTDPAHQPMVQLLTAKPEELVVPVLVVTEAAYLIERAVGPHGQRDLIEDTSTSVYRLECPLAADFARIAQLLVAYADLNLDFVDAAVVATAERLRIDRVATVDQRDFRVIRPITGRPFTLLPWDELPQ